MEYTNDFFIQAQGLIERTFRAQRDTLLAANGHITSTQKSDASPVTKLDRDLEEKLRSELLKFDSRIGIEGEEFGIEGSRDTYWLIDPIDGTESFVRGGGIFRNVVTLIENGRPYFTVIYQPVSDELFVAAEGEGAYRNGKVLSMVERPLSNARIEMHSPGKKKIVWDLMQVLSQHINAVRTTGDFLAVAKGELDALLVFNGGGGPWDFAPRALIIKEAGGRVENLNSSKDYNFRTNDMLAAHPAIFDELMTLITTFTHQK